MPSSDNTSIVIVLGAILLLSLFYLFSGQPIHNEGSLQTKRSVAPQYINQEYDNESESQISYDESSDYSSDNSSEISDETIVNQVAASNGISRRQADEDDATDSSLEIIRERAMGLDGPYFRRKNGNRYKHNSYRALGAGTNLKQIDKYFKVDDVMKNYTDRFVPMDDNYGEEQNAPIDITNIKGTEQDKYNSNNFLPQQKEKDWFETIETVDVKNSHLINIYRPIGVNTIGSTHKGAIWDIRGLDKAVCPKFVVSPFLQSSWEPDRSSKSLCA